MGVADCKVATACTQLQHPSFSGSWGLSCFLPMFPMAPSAGFWAEFSFETLSTSVISRIMALSDRARVSVTKHHDAGAHRLLTDVDVVLCRGLEPSNEVVLLHKLVQHLRIERNTRDITLWHANS